LLVEQCETDQRYHNDHRCRLCKLSRCLWFGCQSFDHVSETASHVLLNDTTEMKRSPDRGAQLKFFSGWVKTKSNRLKRVAAALVVVAMMRMLLQSMISMSVRRSRCRTVSLTLSRQRPNRARERNANETTTTTTMTTTVTVHANRRQRQR
jgi:hypothetical protein